MGKIVSICSEKGGVGKTTLTVSLATHLATEGYKVLVIDFDAQCNSSTTLGYPLFDDYGRPLGDGKPTVTELIFDTLSGRQCSLKDYIREGEYGVSYIPASKLFNSLTPFLMSTENGSFVLKRIMANEEFKDFDFIFFDNHTIVDIMVANSFNCSDYVLIASDCDKYSFDGLMGIIDNARSIQNTSNKDLKILGIVMNKKPRTLLANSIVDNAKEIFNDMVFNISVPYLPGQAGKFVLGAGEKSDAFYLSFNNVMREFLYRIYLDTKGDEPDTKEKVSVEQKEEVVADPIEEDPCLNEDDSDEGNSSNEDENNDTLDERSELIF